MSTEKKSISLVLGSGGARGYAHIGVIEVLLEHGYEIKSISGSSMGSLIGALYACGKLQAYKDWVLGLDLLAVTKLLDFSFTNSGVIQGNKVFSIIEEMIGDMRIEDLPIPFTAVATDLIKQKEVWIQKGNLIDAVRASIAIPTIFTPKMIDGRYLIDGGVLNPLPIAPTLSDNTEMTVAVNLGAKIKKDYILSIPPKEREKMNGMEEIFVSMLEKTKKLMIQNNTKNTLTEMGMINIMGRTIDMMQNAIFDCKIAGYSPDMIINIPNDACGFYEFNRAYELIELGRIIAKEQLK